MEEPAQRILMMLMLLWFSLFVWSRAQICKCGPSDDCWPCDEEWQALNSSVGGRLLKPTPPALPCYSGNASAECSAVVSSWTDPHWRLGQPGASQYTNWEASATQGGCPLNVSSLGCLQGNLPEYLVNASGIADVQQAVKFAADHNVRLVVKTSGHSYNGQSTAPGSLSIWTRYMKNVTFHDDFRSTGCGVTTGVTAVSTAAGTLWEDVYDGAESRNLVVVGAMPGSAGTSGGYVQGGGHGPLSHMFGLAADNVLEFEVVTADGELLVANECQNQDLFWALRGGGGGTFGVVVSSTHRTYPGFNKVVGVFYSIQSSNAPSLLDVTKKFIEIQPKLSEKKFAGYFELTTSRLFFGYLIPDGDPGVVNETLAGFLGYVSQQPGLTLQLANMKTYTSFGAWRSAASCVYNSPRCVESTGRNLAVASRLIPASVMTDSSMQLAQAMVNVLMNGINRIVGCFTAGGKVSEERDNAVNPVWRQALWQLVLPTSWPEGTPLEEQMQKASRLTYANSILRDVTTSSGSYLNEADYNEPDWQRSFFGVNYEHLKAIKKKVDPNGVFLCHNCVGSEDYETSCKI